MNTRRIKIKTRMIMRAQERGKKWGFLHFPMVLVYMMGCFVLSADGSDAAKPVKDIREVLSREAFEQSGLKKLTQQELIHLSGSLFGWRESGAAPSDSEPGTKNAQGEPGSSVTVQTVAQEEAFGSESIPKLSEEAARKEQPRIMRSSIAGEFRGWDGRTFFELENGQIWKQVDDSVFVRRLQNPAVEIRRGMFGAYYLNVEGFGSRCKVQRLR